MPDHGGWHDARPVHDRDSETGALARGCAFVPFPFSDTLRCGQMWRDRSMRDSQQ